MPLDLSFEVECAATVLLINQDRIRHPSAGIAWKMERQVASVGDSKQENEAKLCSLFI